MQRRGSSADTCGLIEAFRAHVEGRFDPGTVTALRLAALPQEPAPVCAALAAYAAKTNVALADFEVVVDTGLLARDPERARERLDYVERSDHVRCTVGYAQYERFDPAT